MSASLAYCLKSSLRVIFVLAATVVCAGSAFSQAQSSAADLRGYVRDQQSAVISGATVTALRDAVYFPANQHIHPIAVLATWATVLIAFMVLVSHRLGRSPGEG